MNAVNFIPSDSSYGLLQTPRPGPAIQPRHSTAPNTPKSPRGSVVLRLTEDLAPGAQRVLNTTVHAWTANTVPKATLR